MYSNSILASSDSHKRWATEMQKHFPEEHTVDIDFDIPNCVFRVPKPLTETKPEAYAPQRIGLGPYHHLRPELYAMQKKKLLAVREFGERKRPSIILEVVRALEEWEPVVRCCYDQFLDIDGNMLAWIVAVDGLFLLQYLKSVVEVIAARRKDNVRLKTMGDMAGDVIMLENQIPVTLLKKIGLTYRRCMAKDDDIVHDLYIEYMIQGGFLAFCQKYSPLKVSNEWAIVRDTSQSHLLHRMYQLVVNNRGWDNVLCGVTGSSDGYEDMFDPSHDPNTIENIYPPCKFEDVKRAADVGSMMDRVLRGSDEEEKLNRAQPKLELVLPGSDEEDKVIRAQPKMDLVLSGSDEEEKVNRAEPESMDDSLAHLLHHMHRLVEIKETTNIYKGARIGVTRILKEKENPERQALATQVVEGVDTFTRTLDELGIPGAATANRFLSTMRQVPWDKISSMLKKEDPKGLEHPLFEEIEIPSVSEMARIGGIKFTPTRGGIRDVEFKEDEKLFVLPVITMNKHSETVLRNLVAYEAASAEPRSTLELAEYVDLMCGIIDTKDDVEILKKVKIVEGELTNEEIVRVFNGIRRTTGEDGGESRVSKAITTANRQYNDIWRVRVKRKVVEYGNACWKYIYVVITLLVVLVLITKAFCTVFGCPRPFEKNSKLHQLIVDF